MIWNRIFKLIIYFFLDGSLPVRFHLEGGKAPALIGRESWYDKGIEKRAALTVTNGTRFLSKSWINNRRYFASCFICLKHGSETTPPLIIATIFNHRSTHDFQLLWTKSQPSTNFLSFTFLSLNIDSP